MSLSNFFPFDQEHSDNIIYAESSIESSKESHETDYSDPSAHTLDGSFTFTPRFLNRKSDNFYERKFHLMHKGLMTRGSARSLKRKGLKRKISIRSRQHLIPLSEQLRQERGKIETGECSLSGIDSHPISGLFEPIGKPSNILTKQCVRAIVREEIRSHLLILKLSEKLLNSGNNTCSRSQPSLNKVDSRPDNHSDVGSTNFDVSSNVEYENPYIDTDIAPTGEHRQNEDSEEKSFVAHENSEESEHLSESQDGDALNINSEAMHFPEESTLNPSQRRFRTILHLQLEIWEKLLQLKQGAEMLGNIPCERRSEETQYGVVHDFSSAVTTENNLTPDSLFSASLKAVFSKLACDVSSESPCSSLTSHDFLYPTLSCCAKMNEIKNRLSDVEFRIASIHQIIQSVRHQQYRELKARQVEILKGRKEQLDQPTRILKNKQTASERVGDGYMINQTSSAKANGNRTKSDPPTTTESISGMSVRSLNPYDETYYEWRQYRINLQHYKKSERTLALNKRPTLQIMTPPIAKFFENTDNKYRVKKPFFIITPSRTNSF